MAQHQAMISKGGKKSCRKMRIWTQKRNDRIRSAMHQVSRWIVNDVMHTFDPAEYEVVFVMGVNLGWKQEVNLGTKTNQNFVQIPFGMLRHQLAYKLAEAQIDYLEQEESYTSKCSFFDGEPIEKAEQYLGTRQHRGLFITSQGQRIHADVIVNICGRKCRKVASANIARKACAKVWSERGSNTTSNSVKGRYNRLRPQTS